jgi:hypothetical protein
LKLRHTSNYPTDGDIHPLGLCEEIKNFMQREAILSVHGQEVSSSHRTQITGFHPAHPIVGTVEMDRYGALGPVPAV